MRMVICGSVQFASEIIAVKGRLERKGHAVVVPRGIERYASGETRVEDKWVGVQGDVMKDYWRAIEAADAALFVNISKNGVENYIGGNALIEMAMAYRSGKRIYLLNGIPLQNYSDEIRAMEPVVLNGDLTLV